MYVCINELDACRCRGFFQRERERERGGVLHRLDWKRREQTINKAPSGKRGEACKLGLAGYQCLACVGPRKLKK